jgi:hypothetical protein
MPSHSVYLNKDEELWLKENGGPSLFKKWLREKMGTDSAPETGVDHVPPDATPSRGGTCYKCGGTVAYGRCLYCGRAQ